MWFYKPQAKKRDPLEPKPRWVRYSCSGSSGVAHQMSAPFGYIKPLHSQQTPHHTRYLQYVAQSVRSTQDRRSGFAVTVLQTQARHIPPKFGCNDQSVHGRKHPHRVYTTRSKAVPNNLETNYMPERYFP